MNILVINPGSTSTKISLFNNRDEVFTSSVFHDAPLLLRYKSVNDQLPMRIKVTEEILIKHSFKIEDVDVFVGRGGSAHSQREGLTLIDDNLYRDTFNEVAGTDHAAKLGVMIAYTEAKKYHKEAFTINPTNTDELSNIARITGIKGLYKRPQSHVLNQKAVVALIAKKIGKKVEDSSFVCAHIDGGITVAAHYNGRMIDSTEGAGGDGAFSPTRIGSTPVMGIVRYLEKGHSLDELKSLCSRSGGFVSHFGTSDASIIYKKKLEGDEKASLIWDAMLYQTSKEIGAMATVLKGRVDKIILTGGLVRYTDVVSSITERVSFISDVVTYPGELEQEAMAWAVMDYFEKKTEVKKYIPKDVFNGFPWDDVIY